PTASQSFRDGHETPRRSDDGIAGLAVGTTVHCEPSHRSASAELLALTLPTAMQNVVETHDTALRPAAPPALGLGENCHAKPFQCSMSAMEPPPRRFRIPTAKQSAAWTHETPESLLVDDPVGTGLETIRHGGATAAPLVAAESGSD